MLTDMRKKLSKWGKVSKMAVFKKASYLKSNNCELKPGMQLRILFKASFVSVITLKKNAKNPYETFTEKA